jgi:hypothetical protein
VHLHRTFHFFAVAIFRRKEIGTHKEQNEMRTVQVRVNFTLNLGPWIDSSVMPLVDSSAALEHRKVRVEVDAQLLVTVGVRDEDSSPFRIHICRKRQLKVTPTGTPIYAACLQPQPERNGVKCPFLRSLGRSRHLGRV